jgi:DNA-directed RNA polymerase subunit K/omega
MPVLPVKSGGHTGEGDHCLDVLALPSVRRDVESRETAANHASDAERLVMVSRPYEMNAFEFVVVSTLRAQQLMKGCIPRLDGEHKAITMAQMEVSAGKIAREVPDPIAPVD